MLGYFVGADDEQSQSIQEYCSEYEKDFDLENWKEGMAWIFTFSHFQ